jgi:hypothetical protein
MYVNAHIRLANYQFVNSELWKCYRLGQVVFTADMVWALESAACVSYAEVLLFVCIASMYADFLRCHLDRVGIWLCGFDEALPGVFLSQPSPFYTYETQHPDSFLLRPS